jgi:UDP-N-acetylglucosamine 2-epimerase (non-hydrolysing)
MGVSALKVLLFFGTRPEAIKLAPVLQALRSVERIEPVVCVSAQHRELLDQALQLFSIAPDYDLDLMRPDQDLFQITRSILERIEPVLSSKRPDLVIVQGDAHTAFVGALASYYAKIPIAHVEAGLRTHDKYAPFPEEMNRAFIDRVADLHFASTKNARENLLAEGLAEESVYVTGNTEIDALFLARERVPLVEVPISGKVILVTVHRRESFHGGILRICEALRELAQRRDVTIVYPVHPNPNVRRTVEAKLAGRERISLIDPLDYVSFVHLMARATIIFTDSGGVQEGAAALHIPLLVLRDTTERVEGLQNGGARLVGTDPERIVAEANRLLDDKHAYDKMARAKNPYGDGHAATRIVEIIEERFL